MTHPRVLANPMSVEAAVRHVRCWIEQPPLRILQPGARFSELFLGYLERHGCGGNLTTDTHLAALAVEYQAVLHSADADFSRFSGLRWKNPLVLKS
jgi:predicted nucleic acid-binding protein